MDKSRFLATAASAAVLGGALWGGPARAQDCNDLWNTDQVLTLNITMDPAQWDALRFTCSNGFCDPPPHTYYQANLECGTNGPMLVGIRQKSDLPEPSGADPQKVSLKIDVNEFVPGQLFAGKKKLSLENGSEGATVSEGLSWQTYQAAGGFVAGRSAWVNVYVNGAYKGLYSNVEQVDKVYLTDHGLDDGGFLFKMEEQRTREDPPESNPFAFNWYPFDHPDPLVTPLESTPPDWRDQALWRVNMPNLLHFAAAENFISNTDGAIQKMNNYFYYDWSILPGDDPAGQQPRLYFPWDLDTVIKSQETELDILDSGPGQLQQGLIEEIDSNGVPYAEPTFQADYFTIYKDLLNGPLALSQTLAMVNGLEPLLSPHIIADPYQQLGKTAAEEFQRLRDFMQDRTNSLVIQLGDLGQGYPLQTSVLGNGIISRNPSKPTIYDANEVVELTAVPDPGWVFVAWTNGVRAAQNPLLVTMDAAKTATAYFAPSGQTVAIYDFNTNGGVDRFAFGTFTDSWAQDLNGIRRQCPEVCTEVTTITSDAYGRLALSDALGGDTDPNRYINPDEGSQDESTLIVEFNIAEDPADVLQIDVVWEGYGDNTHHMELYIWDYVQGNWGNGAGLYGEDNFMDDGSGDADFVLSGSVTTSVSNYISPAGQITLLIYDDSHSEDSFHDYVRVVLTVPADCNNNGVADDIDIAGGTSQDCNSNGVPDECDIAEGTSEDCNTNAIPDACDIAGGTSSDANGNGTPDECEGCTGDPDCDDGLYCNGAETCDTNGVCQPGTAVDCDDSVGCTDDSCDEVNDQCVNAPNNGLCANGDLCDGIETCDPVLDCQAGTPLDCNDGVGCTIDTCQPATGCVNAASNGLCDNGQFCDGPETCDPVLDCQAGVPVDCNDSVACTVDSCDEVNDVCVNAASNGLCDNGDYCDGVETCDPLFDCQAGTPVDCDDSVGCTVDSCDETNDTCVNAASNGLCDNGEFCDGVETCDPLLDCQAGTPVDCDDGVGCTVDSCDEVNDTCVNAASNGLCDNGEFCDGVETCDPLLDCQAGVPIDCDDSVGCTVDSCDEVNDTCVNAASNGLCDNGQYCDGSETCDPLLDCQAGAPVDCSDGVGCTVDSCDEVNDTCVNAASNGLCDNGQYCDGVETCDPLLDCQAAVPVDCSDGVGCTVDSCDEVNDVCVNAASNGLCDNGQFCDGSETCDPLLDCQVGTPVDCADGVDCTVDSCDEVNDVCVNAASNGSCDNGQFCDGVETCDPLLDCQAGVPVDCDDSVGCTVDSCDEVNDVCVNAASNGLCDNGQYCDGVETCDPLLDCQAAVPVDCSDGVGCTVDSCDEVNDVCVNAASNGLCDNGQFCDGSETCDPLLDCQAGAPVDCDDSVGCTVDSCDEVNDTCVNAASNGLCDNGQYCDGSETCDPLLDCQAGAPVDCSDGVGCTVDSCDEVNDTCVNAASNGLCDNGQYCDGVETCDPLLDCQAGTPVDCADSVVCTVDSCDEVNDVCVNAASNGLCDNGDYCDGAETCDPLLDCQAGTPVDCGDGVGCTVDSCDEVNDVCVNTPNNGLCDNGDYCDGPETCDPLLDCQPGTAVDCDDSVGCTVDSCDEVNDICVNTPNNGLCDNGDYCDGVETCDPLLDCQGGTPVDCSDGVGCTVDSCDEVNDTCVNAASNGLCDNGQYCDGSETCDPLLDCQAGAPVDCDDSVGCTVDSCDEVNDVCVNAASNGLCDNGQYCDGSETCDPLLDCQAGVPVDCADSVGCTVDSCDEVNDVCVNAASNGLCDNGEYCDGVETCDPLLDCQAGTPVDCADSVVCTVDSCDEVNDVCVNAASNGLCDNGEFCDGVETCDPLLDCQASTPVDCADGVGCTVDWCDEVNDTCVNAPSNGLCDNGEFCDGAETCDPLLDCQAGTPVDCADGVGCTVDGCDEVNDTCVNAPSNGLCDNGEFCDGAETCDPLLDCQAGTPVDCADGVGCTVDWCDEVNDTCVNAVSNGLCDNGEFCDGAETCDALLDCQAGTPVDCSDGVGCTVDSCDEVNDICVNTPDNGLCDNGEFCDGVETCDPVLDCQVGTPVDCADSVGCTVDSCDEANDTCVNAASNGLCDNGEFCDGVETCDPLLDCQAGTDPCPGQYCDEVDDMCLDFCQWIPADEPQAPCGGCADCSCATCEDGQVEMCEMIGYACQWKDGCNDNLAEMTRAAYLWKNGECYCWDDAQLNWFLATCPAPGTGCCAGASRAGDGEFAFVPALTDPDAGATALLPGRDTSDRARTKRIVINIHAPAGTSAVGLEYVIPEGWEVLNASDGGQWDEVHRKVKWGPFLDDLSRKVTLTVHRIAHGGPPGRFYGTVSFDGVNRPIH